MNFKKDDYMYVSDGSEEHALMLECRRRYSHYKNGKHYCINEIGDVVPWKFVVPIKEVEMTDIEKLEKQQKEMLDKANELLSKAKEMGSQIEEMKKPKKLIFDSKKHYTAIVYDQIYMLTFSSMYGDVFTWKGLGDILSGTHHRFCDRCSAEEAFNTIYDNEGTIQQWNDSKSMLNFILENIS